MIIDIDPGIARTGVASAEAAVALANTISASANLEYRGVQFYCGSQQHIESYADRRAAIVATERAAAARRAEALVGSGAMSAAERDAARAEAQAASTKTAPAIPMTSIGAPAPPKST